MENLTPLFIALTGIAVLLQAGVLVAIFVVLKKTSAKMEALAEEVKVKALPTIAQAEAMLTEIRPRVEAIAEQVQDSTAMVRDQVTRTLDRVERTSDIVHKTVISPVRQISGLMQGVTVGLEFLFGGRGRRNGGSRERGPVPQDEMFI